MLEWMQMLECTRSIPSSIESNTKPFQNTNSLIASNNLINLFPGVG